MAMQEQTEMTLNPQVLAMLRCPVTGSALRQEGAELVAETGGRRYAIVDGIVILLPDSGRLEGDAHADVCEEGSDLP